MTAVTKQDSNSTGLRFTRESAPNTLLGSEKWLGLEPNSYKDFGGQYKKVARQPINASRQRRKGVTVDLDASGGYQSDLTYLNIQDFAEGVMFADFRKKTELSVTGVDAATGFAVAAGGAGFVAGSLLFGKDFATSANNGLKKVTSSDGTHVVASGLSTASETGTIVRVGVEGGSGDLVAVSGGMTSTTLDFTTLGLVVGEWIFVGGDATGDKFATAGANGYKRVSAIAAHALTFDKHETDAADAGTGKTVRLFFGRVLKNETGTAIKQYTYQFERTLGAPDDGSSDVQSEYLTGALFDELSLTLNTADKITFDVSVAASGYEPRTAADGVKAGTRPALVSGDGFNTTDHLRRAAMSIVGTASPLFAFLSDVSFTIKNNTKPNKALGTLGAFSQSAGEFEVAAACTAYFADIAAVAAVKDNSDVTVDVILSRSNQAITLDLPLVALGDGRLKIAMNEPITLPLSADAATAVDKNSNMDFTAMFCFFDYVPAAAM